MTHFAKGSLHSHFVCVCGGGGHISCSFLSITQMPLNTEHRRGRIGTRCHRPALAALSPAAIARRLCISVLRLTFLTVVKLVKLAGFRLALAEDQVVSDVPVGVVGRFPLQDDLGGGVGGRNGVQRNRRLWKNTVEMFIKKTHVIFSPVTLESFFWFFYTDDTFCSCSINGS